MQRIKSQAFQKKDIFGKQRLSRRALLLCLALGLSGLTGCTNAAEKKVIVDPPAAGSSVATPKVVQVKRGDFENTLDLRLIPQGYLEYMYIIPLSEYNSLKEQYNITLKAVHVKVGDLVKEGDLLVEFSSEEIDKRIKESESVLAEYNIQLEHLNNLSVLDPDGDYSDEITRIKQEISVERQVVQEIQNEYTNLNLYAKSDGYVKSIDSDAQAGILMPSKTLVETGNTEGRYIAETENPAAYTFMKTGKTYEVQDVTGQKYTVTCEGITEDSAQGIFIVAFSMDLEMARVADSEQLTIHLEGDQIKDALYVGKEYVYTNESGDFVYYLDSNGYKKTKPVTTGGTIEGNTIITSGLEEGDEVCGTPEKSGSNDE